MKIKANLFAITCTALLSACGSGDKIIDNIVDDIETKYAADVTYVNNTTNSISFYLKSTVYNEDVFANKFHVVELPANEVSSSFQHEWINSAEESQFATENAINLTDKATTTLDLTNKKDYWAIALNQENANQIKVIKKQPSNTDGAFKIRVLANENVVIKNNMSDEIMTSSEAGVVSTSFAIVNCTDLTVSGFNIDLCQIADLNNSYLVVFDVQTQQTTIVKE